MHGAGGSRARGIGVTTIEGLGNPDRMHPVQSAFVEHDALQCGFCTPGMVMSVAAALAANPTADLEDIGMRPPETSADAVPIRTCSRLRSKAAANAVR